MKKTVVFVLIALLSTPPISACGPYGIEAAFWWTERPGPELDRFANGELGILQPGLKHQYRYIAWRYLSGIEDGRNSDLLTGLIDPPPDFSRPAVVDEWLEARRAVAGAPDVTWIPNSTLIENEDGSYDYIINCLDDAFRNATETLQRYLESYGAGAPETADWLGAQDDVFKFCGGESTIPEPLDTTADLIADRAYQIATAHFYATRFDEAQKHYAALAAGSSRWAPLADYLVARAQLRGGRFDDAVAHLQALTESSPDNPWHAAAGRLLAYARLRTDPQTAYDALSQALNAPHADERLKQHLIDFHFLLHEDNSRGRELERDDLGHWFHLLETAEGAGHHLFSVASQNLESNPDNNAWLLGTLATAPDGTTTDRLLDPAAAVPKDSPAYLTLAWNRARLLASDNQLDAARAILDDLLANKESLPSLADVNRVRALRASLSENLSEYLGLMVMKPVSVGYDIDWNGEPDFVPEPPPSLDPLLPYNAIEVLNHGLDNPELLNVLKGDLLPTHLRKRLAVVLWTRAAVNGDAETARTVAPIVQELAPTLRDAMANYLNAEPEDRDFEAAFILLRHPGMSPTLRSGPGRQTKDLSEMDSHRDNGWCDDPLRIQALPGQRVISQESLAAVQGGFPEIQASAVQLGEIILQHAQTNNKDPRMAEALHRVVRATRLGCWREDGYGTISKAAFEALHQRFPGSTWAEKTPYWFDE